MHSCPACNQPLTLGSSHHGLHSECFKHLFALGSLSDFQEVTAQKQGRDSAPALIANSSFFHGKFRKYSALLNGKNYILKVEEKDFPELPATELLCNQIFSKLGLKVPTHALILFENKLRCFVTRNFMDEYEKANLIHLYRFFEPGMSYTCENILQIIGGTTERLSAQHDFITLTLADSLIGNNDRHGRNLGFICAPQGYELAPFYDNPSSLAIETEFLLGADLQPRGAIFTQDSKEPTMKDYVREWKRLGFAEVVDRFRSTLAQLDLKALVQSSLVSPKRQAAILRLITKRTEELCR